MATFDLQAAIDAQISAGGLGGIVDLPSGEIPVSDTINVQQVRGLVIRGRAPIVTDLRWEGPSDRPMFRFNRTQGTILERLSITPRTANPLLEGVRIEQGAIDNSNPKHWPDLTSSLMTARNAIFRGQGALGIAIRVYLHSVQDDAKNDHHRFERLRIAGCTYAGLVLEGRNAKAIHLDQVVMSSTIADVEVCQYGVLTVANMCPTSMMADGKPGPIGDPRVNDQKPVYNHGASFTAIGGQLAGNRLANVYLGDRNEALVLQAIYSEKSARWLVVPEYGQGSAGAFPVKMIGCSYSTNRNTPSDLEIVQFYADGPFEIDTCNFGQRAKGEQLRIRYAPNVKPGTFSMRNSAISNDGDGNVFVGDVPNNCDYPMVNRGYRGGKLMQLGIGKT
jgi:hypothetical protein